MTARRVECPRKVPFGEASPSTEEWPDIRPSRAPPVGDRGSDARESGERVMARELRIAQVWAWRCGAASGPGTPVTRSSRPARRKEDVQIDAPYGRWRHVKASEVAGTSGAGRLRLLAQPRFLPGWSVDRLVAGCPL